MAKRPSHQTIAEPNHRLAAAFVAGIALWGCQAELKVNSVSRTQHPNESLVRVFDVVSAQGLYADGTVTGLGFDLTLPQDVSTTPEFQLTVSVRPTQEMGESFYLALASEIQAFERPTRLNIPRRILPIVQDLAMTSIIVKDAQGVRRILPKAAMSWTDDELVVVTSQPMGEWLFSNGIEADNSLDVAVSGLNADESLRFEVAFTGQALASKSFDIELPDRVIFQKVTGDEQRNIVVPVDVIGRYNVSILEAPVKKDCAAVVGEGLLSGKVIVSIKCVSR